MMSHLTEFVKPTNFEKFKTIMLNSKLELSFSSFVLIFYFLINQIQFDMASAHRNQFIEIEKTLNLNFESNGPIPIVIADMTFYSSQICIWSYAIITYVYRNSNDFKFRFWSLLAFYFICIFSFPCYGIQATTRNENLQNKYSNAFSIETALLTLCVGYNFPNKTKYYPLLALVPVYSIASTFLMRNFVLSQLFAFFSALMMTKIPLPFIKETPLVIYIDNLNVV
jgi:hypothetical protein